MKYHVIFFCLFLLRISLTHGQDFAGDKNGLGNFVRRMYNVQPFNGVKLFQTEDGKDFIISVVEIRNDPSRPESIQSRLATIKAKSYASEFLNGSNISSEVFLITNQVKTKDSVIAKTTIQEMIKESSTGFIDEFELLIKFNSNDSKQMIYVFYKKINSKVKISQENR